MRRLHVFSLTSLSFAALIYLSGCGDDSPPATNTAPEFEQDTYSFTLAENAATGDEIGSVSATDADENATLTYSITTTQTDFAINASTGAVTVAEATLDFESTTSYTLAVQVSDGTDTDAADITVMITDVNESSPEFAFADNATSYSFSLAADAADGAEVGKISATDADGTAMLSYTLSDEDAANFAITDGTNVASGTEVSVVVAADADLPSLTSPVELTITVNDGENTVNATAEIVITSVGTGTNAAPVFANTPYTFTVASDASDDAVVGTVSATDSNADDMLTYSLSGEGADNFAISSTPVASGEEVSITVATNADLPSLTSPVALAVEVSDGTDQVTANVEITITVGNVAPVFDQTAYTFTVASDASDDAVVGTVSATDSNAGDLLAYSLSGEGADNFAISSTPVASGEEVSVTVAANADLSSLGGSVTLTVTVTDDAATALTATVAVAITIMEGNVAPVFANTSYSFSLSEDASDDAVVGTVSATDSNADDLLTYSLNGEGADNFAISSTPVASDEEVSVTVAANADLSSLGGSVALTVTVTDDAAPALTDDATVAIMIIEGNVAPVFGQTDYTFTVNEDAENGDVVDAVSATDSNAGDMLTYSLSGEGADNFAISNTPVAPGTDVQITVSSTASLDHETVDSYTLTVEASDDDTSALTATATVTINVNDINEHAPAFAQASYTFSVDENSPVDTEVGTVEATDADGTAVLSYRMVTTQTNFDIDANTGEIKVGTSASLDFETTPSYMLQVEASDGTNAATADVTIDVVDVNDNAPVFSGAPYTFGVEENSPVDTEVGMVSATDADANTTLQYSIVGTQTDFGIDSGTGEMTVASATLDFETTPSYTLEVQARDGAVPAMTATAEVTINVGDVNEAPAFGQTAYTFGIVGSAASSGDEVGTVVATDDDAGATLEYSITNTQTEFDIDANTGIITVSDAAAFDRTTTPSYELTVQASDGPNTATATLTINILGVDYDADGDGLIEINNLEQLNAMRWDPDGDGMPAAANQADYVAAFPDAAEFVPAATGYELMRNLDFDAAESYGSGALNTAWTTGTGWDPIGRSIFSGTPFTATFDGNSNTLSNLYINRGSATEPVGLFGFVNSPAIFRKVGLLDVDVTGARHVGSLAGLIEIGGAGTVTIESSYATGTVTGTENVGGLIGRNNNTAASTGTIALSKCYSECTVTGTGNNVGGLCGSNSITSNNASTISTAACYATGDVTGNSNVGGLIGFHSAEVDNAQDFTNNNIIYAVACYATGDVTGMTDNQSVLIGDNDEGFVSACYATGMVATTIGMVELNPDDFSPLNLSHLIPIYFDNTVNNAFTTGVVNVLSGKTTVQLQEPTGYTGIYMEWNVDIDDADGDGDITTGSDDPWDFGTSGQYPVLKVDFNGDGSTADDVTRQRQ